MSAIVSSLEASPWRTDAPIYRDIAKVIEREILDGKWKPGERIPPEPELIERFGASRGTLRMAISELVNKGLLYRQSGRGTFVIGPELESVTRFFRFEHLRTSGPIVLETRVLEQRHVAADAETAAAFGVPPRTKVALVRRLRSYADQPFLIVDSHFVGSALTKISGADFTVWPLYDVLRSRFGLHIISVDEFQTPGLASPDEAALLDVEPGSAVIRLERISYSFDAEPVEYRRAVGRGDSFRYHVELR
jgi:GntR family transcriptional regulator